MMVATAVAVMVVVSAVAVVVSFTFVAAFAMLMMVMMSALAIIVVAVFAAAAAVVVFGWIKLLGSGVAHGNDGAGIAHGLAGELMVKVDGHLVVGNFLHESVDAVAVGRLHGHHCALKHLFAVELAIHVEDALVDFHNHVGILGAESFFGCQREVEGSSLLKVLDAFHEAFNHALVEPEHKCVGTLGSEFEYRCLAIAIDDKNLVSKFNIFAKFDSFHI